MFDKNFDINGFHADYLKDLCELRGNVPDMDLHKNFKIFKSYVDAYTLCPVIGYQYSRKGQMGPASEGNVGIMAEQMIKKKWELTYVYQILMLIDEESEPDTERRIYRAFHFSEKTEEDRLMIEENMCVFNAYFLGGVEVLHENFVDECKDRDDYLYAIYNFTKQFNEEQDPDALKVSIDKMINMQGQLYDLL